MENAVKRIFPRKHVSLLLFIIAKFAIVVNWIFARKFRPFSRFFVWSAPKNTRHQRRQTCRAASPRSGKGMTGGAVRMGTQVLLHPGHAVPAAEFVAAPVELPHHMVAHAPVEADAVSGQVLVLLLGAGDAGAGVDNVLHGQQFLQRAVQGPAQAAPPAVLPDIDGDLRRPGVGGPLVEGAGVGVAGEGPVPLCSQVGVPLQGFPDAPGKVGQGGDLVLVSDGRSAHVGRVDRQKLRRVAGLRDPQRKGGWGHGERLLSGGFFYFITPSRPCLRGNTGRQPPNFTKPAPDRRPVFSYLPVAIRRKCGKI